MKTAAGHGVERMSGVLPSRFVNGYDATELALFRVVSSSLFGDPEGGGILENCPITRHFPVD
jgi:hypothetical protein